MMFLFCGGKESDMCFIRFAFRFQNKIQKTDNKNEKTERYQTTMSMNNLEIWLRTNEDEKLYEKHVKVKKDGNSVYKNKLP